MSAPRAPLIEVFHSIQGEGRFAGVPMAFVRVATCPIRCRYCDTPHSYSAEPELVVAAPGGERREPNPVDAGRAAALVEEVGAEPAGPRDPVSVTGGEPLVFPAFVAALGARLREAGRRVHLETAALDPGALAGVLPEVDHVSADYKLPGTLAEGFHGPEHLACVERALGAGCTVDVKLVLTAGVDPEGVAVAARELARFAGAIEVVLQPVTPFGAVREPCPAEVLAAARERFARVGIRARVLPQLHRQLGVP